MTGGALPLADRNRLAMATRASVLAVGGVESAAAILGKSKSQIGRCQSVNDPDCLNVADALALMMAGTGMAGHDALIRVMAQLAGGVFVALPDVHDDGPALSARLVDLMARTGALMATGGAALADGRVDRAEAAAMLDHLDAVNTATAGMAEWLRGVLQGGE